MHKMAILITVVRAGSFGVVQKRCRAAKHDNMRKQVSKAQQQLALLLAKKKPERQNTLVDKLTVEGTQHESRRYSHKQTDRCKQIRPTGKREKPKYLHTSSHKFRCKN